MRGSHSDSGFGTRMVAVAVRPPFAIGRRVLFLGRNCEHPIRKSFVFSPTLYPVPHQGSRNGIGDSLTDIALYLLLFHIMIILLSVRHTFVQPDSLASK